MFFLALLFSSLTALANPGVSPPVYAAEPIRKPLAELGLLGGFALVPAYPAADQTRLHYLVFPYGVYRGEIFHADQESGIKARVIRDAIFGFDLSGAGSFPANASGNEARLGMPDLDWIGEVGPRLYARLITQKDRVLQLNLPARAVFSTNFRSLRHRGWVFAPGLTFRSWLGKDRSISWAISTSASFATEPLQAYFYQVAPEYATSSRPTYNAKSGYMGFRVAPMLAIKAGQFNIALGASVSNHSGAANVGSPLFKRHTNLSLFTGLIWTFYKTKALEAPTIEAD